MAIDELGNVERDLQREAGEDSELRERHRAAWRRPASAALNAKFLEKVAGERRPCCMPTGMSDRAALPSACMGAEICAGV